jgi:hypothetical protein
MTSNDTQAQAQAQAQPLPSKRGEIGYIEAAESPTEILHTVNAQGLPATRRPADRDHSSAVTPPPQSEVVTACPSIANEQSPSTASITKSHGILDLFKPEGPPAFGGLRLFTLVIFAAQLILLGGTATAWLFTSERLTQIGQTTIIPFHIIFAVLVLAQIVLLERCLFRLRGERYTYIHPGQTLLRHRNMSRSSMTLLAPWNRTSLPTYAAALSQSGVGTGDVEDHLIAAPPPPAYGNTRDSTLLLRAFLRNSIGANSGGESGTGRFVSTEEQEDQVQNAERARRLEETMNRFEPPPAAHIVIH